jgi:hypothetical protein
MMVLNRMMVPGDDGMIRYRQGDDGMIRYRQRDILTDFNQYLQNEGYDTISKKQLENKMTTLIKKVRSRIVQDEYEPYPGLQKLGGTDLSKRTIS